MGRNTAVIYNKDLSLELEENLHLKKIIKNAFFRNEFEVHYQPKIDAQSLRVIGMESLLRWDSSKLGGVSPAKFIPAAEESGFIVTLGMWALEESLRHLSLCHESGFPDLTLSVNLSPRQILQSNVLETIIEKLMEYDVDPQFLELEITEGILLK